MVEREQQPRQILMTAAGIAWLVVVVSSLLSSADGEGPFKKSSVGRAAPVMLVFGGGGGVGRGKKGNIRCALYFALKTTRDGGQSICIEKKTERTMMMMQGRD